MVLTENMLARVRVGDAVELLLDHGTTAEQPVVLTIGGGPGGKDETCDRTWATIADMQAQYGIVYRLLERGSQMPQDKKTSNKIAKDVPIPEWDGDRRGLVTYLRNIDLWSANTTVPQSVQGVRLLSKLGGEVVCKMGTAIRGYGDTLPECCCSADHSWRC